ncbi:hypothetical protein BpHYR1_018776 [Brachionus plicatilis]|uniref:Uncharacterized protein n=1 Tax=Brachionus plicatilis TaxID=10195 RepID=A0A3M7QXZ2_BRAPC|nr:hypothetical protein BpHYR1_018776 [Brachionus plicatilis]
MSSTSILENNFNDTCNFDSVRMDIPIQSNRKKGRPKKNTKGSPFCKMTKRRYWACPNKCDFNLTQDYIFISPSLVLILSHNRPKMHLTIKTAEFGPVGMETLSFLSDLIIWI